MAHFFNTQFPAALGIEMNLQKPGCTTIAILIKMSPS
jgi:hypothetical protein